MTITRLFDSHHYGVEAIQLNSDYSYALEQLTEALTPFWKGETIRHYCYRDPTLPIHVLGDGNLEITINIGQETDIPKGFDLQDELRTSHITIELKDSVDLLALIEYLRCKLALSIDHEFINKE
ncbi:hypothetical protein A165_00915 [Vibrio tasmaniensis ZS-17]|uniref:hypothetical protein n=1 Tax=Vibrio tasmaniensis TaxID=212663 RepID=UPI0002FD3D42|nr:hypothetical protein [Vibrio tasmaniensis]OED65906.1 hypothetical protein A165_00915 [Vibrio tasmaniensis ZS-17]